jgi:hypothetical protein
VDKKKSKSIRNILILIGLVLIILLILNQCSSKPNNQAGETNKPNDSVSDTNQPSEREGNIYIKIKGDTVTNSGFSYQVINETDDDYYFTEIYEIYQETAGKWVAVIPIHMRDYYPYAIQAPANTTVDVELDFGLLYGPLKPGTYRYEFMIALSEGNHSVDVYDDFIIK